ncbi:CHAT domain-containing protein [Flavihumibacter stibioxidans]|uniref:CHAT domain-containing protein n=1 Tax=Flavihumibacter stibioxidans TaxID=1834163 RepID=A0ABR7M667_9BACT|nr:CHAT domain-containing protein [Flavihumibacter stibioxidans]MBC6490512.1 hypothetical protein [Flavihumibacter stibioxidans]
MPVKAISTFSVLLLLTFWIAFSQDADRLARAARLFDLAERQYNSEAPTPASDSLALRYYKETIAAYLETGDLPVNAINSFIRRGNILQGQRKYGEAIPEYHTAIRLSRGKKDMPQQFYLAHLYLGTNYYYSFKIDSARYYLEAASDLVSTNAGLPEQDVLFNSLGALYLQSANYEQARNYFSKALLLLDPSVPEYRETSSGFLNNIAYCMMLLDDHQGAFSIYHNLLADPYLRNRVMQNIGHTHFDQGNYDSAMFYFKRVTPRDNSATVRMLQEMARVNIAARQFPSALQLIDSSISLNRRINGAARDYGVAQLLKAVVARELGGAGKALNFIEEGLSGVNEINAPVTLFELLELKADLLVEQFNAMGSVALLQESVKNYIAAIRVANFIRSNFDNDEAKLFFNRDQRAIYQRAAFTVYRLFEKTKDKNILEEYLFVEESLKGNVLGDNLRKNRFRMASTVEPGLLKQENELKQSLAYYTTLVNAASDTALKHELEQERVNAVVALSRLQKKFEKYPGYKLYSSGNLQDGHLLSGMMKSMGKDNAIISYLALDSLFLCLAVSHESAGLFKIDGDSLVKHEIRQFVSALHDRKEGSRYNGYQYGKSIYQKLVDPAWQFCGKQKRWTIITDGILHYIPFEAIPVSGDPGDYLVKHKELGYHYSFSLLNSNKAPQLLSFSDSSWKTLAPFAIRDSNIMRTGLPVLSFSNEEATGKDMVVFKGAAAAKNIFLSQAHSARVLHIATHATANEDSPNGAWINFYPTNPDSVMGYRMFLQEVYPLNLQHTELVILSACETAMGELSVGEGLLSLSRGFLYAGAKGVVASLWLSEDKVTAYLISHLHRELEKGKPVELALQSAKIAFLEDESVPASFKSPNYWSHLVYIGGATPADQRPSRHWLIAGVVLLVSAIALVVLRRLFRGRYVPGRPQQG